MPVRSRPLVWLGIAALLVALPYLGISPRWLQLLVMIGINALLAQSMNIVGGYAGQLSLGQAAIYAAGAYGSAVLSMRLGWPVYFSIPGGIIVAMAAGLLVALPAGRVRDFYLGMVTLGFGVVAYEILQYWEPVTGGFMGLSNIPSPTLRNLVIAGHRVTLGEFTIAVVVLVVAVSWLKANLIQSHVGRAFVAVSESDVVSSCLGISPGATKLLAYVTGAAWAGLAGGIYAHLTAYISPEDFNLWTSVAILVMAVFGGFRTFEGPFLGAVFFTLLPELTQDFKEYQLLAYGLILMMSYVLLPRGVAGLWNGRTSYVRGRDRSAGDASPHPAIASASLTVERVQKSFGGVQALGDVSLEVRAGTIHGLLGPNGSGKSTLINLISGILAPTSGRVLCNGASLAALKPFEIARKGVGRTFQNPQLFGAMTVRENVLTGAHLRFRANFLGALLRLPGFRRLERAELAKADAILRQVGLADDADTIAAGLSYGKKRLLEVARCLAVDPAILILDEPAAGLSEPELEQLSALLRALNGHGMTILLIEHHLDFLFRLVDAVTVLEHGEVIFDGLPDAARQDAKVVDAYLGSYVHA